MQSIQVAMARATARLVELLPELLAALLVAVLFVGAGRFIGAALARMLGTERRSNRYTNLLIGVVRTITGLIGIILGLQILGLTAVATSLLATGGFMAIILGFAFREIGENLLAGLFLGISRSFEVGDLIESSGHLGKVRAIDLRQVWIRSADGRDIFIPSAQIFRNVLVNYTRDGLRRGDFVVGIDYADDAAGARALLLEQARRVEHVLSAPEPSVRISEFAAQYCELQVFFWIDTERSAGLGEVRSRVMAECLQALRDRGYTLSSDVSTAVSVSHVDSTDR